MSELPYLTVSGPEVHVQLMTRTKLSSGCLTRFGLPLKTPGVDAAGARQGARRAGEELAK